MTDKPGHNDKGRSDRMKVLERFRADERNRIEEIWEASARACTTQPEVTAGEVEDALSAIHRRLNFGDTSSDAGKRLSDSRAWRWILAAAVVLLVLGAGILFVPQTETAPYGEITAVTLPDGSVVELNSGSQVWYNRFFALTNRTVHLDGEAFFSVRSGDLPYVVHANDAVVKVTGTKFNVRSWSDDLRVKTEVTVSEGDVQFSSLGSPDKSVTVAAGQLSRWTSGLEKPTAPEPVKLDRMLGWRNHQLVFSDEPLAVIFNELERRFDTAIELESEGIAQETLTTFYAEPGNAEKVLKEICRVKGLRYAETADGFRVYR